MKLTQEQIVADVIKSQDVMKFVIVETHPGMGAVTMLKQAFPGCFTCELHRADPDELEDILYSRKNTVIILDADNELRNPGMIANRRAGNFMAVIQEYVENGLAESNNKLFLKSFSIIEPVLRSRADAVVELY